MAKNISAEPIRTSECLRSPDATAALKRRRLFPATSRVHSGPPFGAGDAVILRRAPVHRFWNNWSGRGSNKYRMHSILLRSSVSICVIAMAGGGDDRKAGAPAVSSPPADDSSKSHRAPETYTRPLDIVRLMRRYTVVLLMLATTACQYDPFAHEFTKVRPETGKLVGVYELDDESTEMLRRKYKLVPPTSKFVLRSDGTFSISEVPTCWREPTECSSATESADGTWQVKKLDEWWEVRLRCTKIQGEPSDYGLGAHVRGDRPPQLLHFTVGDPDSGEALAFRKVREQE